MSLSTGTGRPLQGIRVLEICHMLAGPYCGMLMADLGAEVIKIETGQGDLSRSVGPDYVGSHNVYFASLNRNKKSVVLDLGDERQREDFHKLVASADALITNLRPRAIRKLGLTYEALRPFNDRIVCLALTGFGMTGARSELPAYDYIIQALSGLMMLTGEPGGGPVRAGYSVVDNTGGMMGVIGVLAKLVEGRGGQIDVALFDTMLSQLNYLAAACMNGGEAPQRFAGGAHPYMVPAQIFPVRDGHVALFISHDTFWKKFALALEKTDWLADERFATMAGRRENREHVIAEISAVLAGRTVEEWVALLQPLGVVIAGVRTLEDALDSGDAEERDMVVSIPVSGGVLKLVANPLKIDDADCTYAPPPLLGEHGRDLLVARR